MRHIAAGHRIQHAGIVTGPRQRVEHTRVRQEPGRSAVRVDDPDPLLTAPVRHEPNLLPVVRKRGTLIKRIARGQRMWVGSVGSGQPEIALAGASGRESHAVVARIDGWINVTTEAIGHAHDPARP